MNQIEKAKSRTSESMKGSLIYGSWINMRQRCNNKKRVDYVNYGGRGISVCKEWESFDVFMADMGVPPEGFSIERIDNNGNYEKANCRWASKEEQSRNKRTNKLVTIGGVTKPLIDWCATLGLKYWTVHSRIRRGWSFQKALGYE